MTRRVGWILTILLLSTAGCGGLLPSSPAPRFYGLDYPTQPLTCPLAVKANLRVWPLSASPPYDREQMIVTGTDRRLSFSSQYRWITKPGDMVADKLIRDLSAGGLFQGVASTADPLDAKLQLGGRVFRFAMEEGADGAARPVLEVELLLWRQEPRGEVLFRKHYRIEGPTQGGLDPLRFSESMSELVRQLSQRLADDLCAIRQDSSFGVGD